MSMTPTPAPKRAFTADFGRPLSGWRLGLYTVIFEADTRAGRAFDLTLIGCILASVAVVVVLDSMAPVHGRHAGLLKVLEWVFTLLFTIEYVARLACVRHPWRYARSGFGIIDLLAALPTYLAVLVPGLSALIDMRVLRLLRVFRIFKLAEYVAEFGALGHALAAPGRKIFVFMSVVMLSVVVMGTLMYVVEGPANGYTSIPVGVYWAITTMTTVSFGDTAPKADLGRILVTNASAKATRPVHVSAVIAEHLCLCGSVMLRPPLEVRPCPDGRA
jgi:voltage-gated potassium channel